MDHAQCVEEERNPFSPSYIDKHVQGTTSKESAFAICTGVGGEKHSTMIMLLSFTTFRDIDSDDTSTSQGSENRKRNCGGETSELTVCTPST